MIDRDHPEIRRLAEKLTHGTFDERSRAVRIHDYVRDAIHFGWTGDFYQQSASEVLRSGVGYCNTKSTLFVALLRASGIPARQHFVTIPRAILHGLIDPGTHYVDHSYTEIRLGGRWIATDSYILDRRLAERARQRLRHEGRRMGYGAHVDGVSDWDGERDAYSQFVNRADFAGPGLMDHGVHADVDAFYRSGQGLNPLTPSLRLLFGGFAWLANRRIEAIRSG